MNAMTTESEELKIKFEDFDKICRFCYKRSHYLRPIFEEIDEKPDADLINSFTETVDTVGLLDINLGLKVIQFRIVRNKELYKQNISIVGSLW